MQNILSFLKISDCRQKFITDYFGQQDTKDCGICDNCLEKKVGSPDDDTMADWKNKIIKLLKQNQGVFYRDVLMRFPMNKRAWAENLIKEMIAENLIIRKQEVLRLNDPENIKQS